MPSLARPALRAALRVGAIAEPLFGGKVCIDGHRLDPEIHAALVAAKAAGIRSIEEMPVDQARAHAAKVLATFDAAPLPMARIVETSAPGPAGPIPVHVYQPFRAQPAMLVYFHGGGGVIGSLETYDVLARLLADRTRCHVAMVEYRLAPEHPHPAAIDDAVAAWRWAHGRASDLGVDTRHLGVGGDSFGGFLATWVDRRARTEQLPAPAVVAMAYPLVDQTQSSPSIDTLADGYVLTRAMIRWFRANYSPDPASWRDQSPIFFDDLAGAAPTLVVTAGFDPLRDEGRAYADRLSAAGARVRYRCETDLIHGFLGMTGAFRRCDEALGRYCSDLVEELLR